jgi:cytochrome P450
VTSTVEPAPAARVHGLPLLGILPQLRRGSVRFLLDARADHGDLYFARLGLANLLVLNHPRHARHVLVDRHAIYRKQGAFWDAIRSYLGAGLLTSEGEIWRRQRQWVAPVLLEAEAGGLTELMSMSIGAVLDRWAPSLSSPTPLDVLPLCCDLSLNVSASTMFGRLLTAEESAALSSLVTAVVEHLVWSLIFEPLPAWLPIPGRLRHRRVLADLRAAIEGLVYRCETSRSAAGPCVPLALKLQASGGSGMSRQELLDQVVTLFVGAYETTSLALAWTLHLLAREPAAQSTLERQVDEVLGWRPPSAADLPALNYAGWVFKEALRCFPPAYWIPRVAIADDVIDGVPVPAGTTVAVAVFAIHHHPEIWEAPERFRPERFQWGSGEKGAWIPFGSGPRVCTGMRFALLEAQLVLAHIARRYRLSAPPGAAAGPALGTLLRPRPAIVISIDKRDKRKDGQAHDDDYGNASPQPRAAQ